MIRLCSSSTTRAEILRNANIEFIQQSCDFDEDSLNITNPKTFVYEATKGKFECCLKKYGLDLPLLVADTVVSSNGKILRKAKDIDDAKRILLEQSGRSISIISCMIYKKENLELIDISSTIYKFKPFCEKDLDEYLKSSEWKGKAGACMVEGFCKKYIESVLGYESNAMGLCVEKLKIFL